MTEDGQDANGHPAAVHGQGLLAPDHHDGLEGQPVGLDQVVQSVEGLKIAACLGLQDVRVVVNHIGVDHLLKQQQAVVQELTCAVTEIL